MKDATHEPSADGDGLRLRSVTVDFGATRALAEVTLSVAPGELVAAIGPSGSGKTTLLGTLNATVAPTEGSVSLFGREVTALDRRALREVRATIAVIPQDLALVPNLRVVQNVVMGGFGRRRFAGSLRDLLWPAPAAVERVFAILERLGIPEKLYHRTDTLSGGQQQRVALARCLFQNPRAILADEPVSSVDPARARDVVSLLTRIATEEGSTLVMSLHNLELARAFFPRVIGLRDGRVAFDGHPDAIGSADYEALYRLAPRDDDDADPPTSPRP